MNWTQPICPACYAERNPGRTPTKVMRADLETCCDCGQPTRAGIYFRIDPRTVKFAAQERDE